MFVVKRKIAHESEKAHFTATFGDWRVIRSKVNRQQVRVGREFWQPREKGEQRKGQIKMSLR